LYPNNILTWWNTGSDDVSTYIDGDEKGCITVLATISASRQKWPLFFVAKGKTERVDRSQIGNVENHWRAHSDTGWMKSHLFCDYLRHIRSERPGDQQIYLICDLHASHRTPEVKKIAGDLHITLLHIPVGATDELQPLDTVVFGVLKSVARHLFRIRIADNPGLKRSKRDAITDMIAAWNALSTETLEAAWNLYQNEEEWEESIAGILP
jgi:hypothetical protein